MPLLVRRSASGSSTAVVLRGGTEGPGAGGGAASTAIVLPSIAQGQAVLQGGTGIAGVFQGSDAVPHTSSTGAILLQQPNSHHPKAQQLASQAGSGGTQDAVSGSSGSNGSGGCGSIGSGSSDKAAKGASFQLHKVLTGFQLIWRSDYLLLVCSNLLLTYVSDVVCRKRSMFLQVCW
jgi:hypothetical protein